jgi:dTDP-4-dehydrorhamnose reductase
VKHQRVLITGCGGMLGNAIYPYFRSRCAQVLATDIQIEDDEHEWLKYLDARDERAMRQAANEFKPDLILHLAALVDVEQCELRPDDARVSNAETARIAAEVAAERDATLVYISTGGVFDGAKGTFYTEEDWPNPIMIYGATKLDGEHEVAKVGGKYFVLRAGWMVGGGPRNDHKFVSFICDQLQAGARTIFGVTDKIGTPTYTHDFAINLFALLESEKYDTYHMVCRGSGTRYDVAKEIVRICGYEGEVEVKGVDSSHFSRQFWVARPDCEMLANLRLERLGINMMRDWRVAIAEYLHRDYGHVVRARDRRAVAPSGVAAD